MNAIELSPLEALDGVRMPRQMRAEGTMRRIVAAVRKLLQYKDLDAIRIDEVAALAGCSPPSIYARFKDKGTFIGVLFELHSTEMADGVAAYLAPERWERRRLEDFAQGLVEFLLHLYRADRYLYRAVLTSPDAGVRKRFTAETERLADQVVSVLRAIDGGRGGVVSDRGRWALLQMIAALQCNAVIGWMLPASGSGDAMAPHLADMFARAVKR